MANKTVERNDGSFGAYLFDHRKTQGLTQAGLGRLVGVKESTVCHWERGTHPAPHKARLCLALEKALGLEDPEAQKLQDLMGIQPPKLGQQFLKLQWEVGKNIAAVTQIPLSSPLSTADFSNIAHGITDIIELYLSAKARWQRTWHTEILQDQLTTKVNWDKIAELKTMSSR